MDPGHLDLFDPWISFPGLGVRELCWINSTVPQLIRDSFRIDGTIAPSLASCGRAVDILA